MNKSDYQKYLQGEHWQKRRRQFLADNQHCEVCGIPRWLANIAYDQDLHVHHKSYANVGAEQDDDLAAICRRCHDIEHHNRSDFRPVKTATCEVCAAKHYNIYSDHCHKCAGVMWYGVAEAIDWTADEVLFSGCPLWETALQHIVWDIAHQGVKNFDHVRSELERHIKSALTPFFPEGE
jgi:hypothetical protein